jgi:chromosome partitioning protein
MRFPFFRKADPETPLPQVELRTGVGIAIVNNKGGVGKTTTAVSLAAALATGHRVLLLDLDSQGTATLALGYPVDYSFHAPDEVTMGQVLCDEAPVYRAIRQTPIERLDLIPGGMELSESLQRLAYKRLPFLRLQAALEHLRDRYDFILMDCAPSFSLISRNALLAADGFIVPIVPQFLAMEGFNHLRSALAQLQQEHDHVASLWGIVLTMVDHRAKMTAETIHHLRQTYGSLVFQTEIPVNIRLAEAPRQGESIFQYAPESKGALRYWELTRELLTVIDNDEGLKKRRFVAREPGQAGFVQGYRDLNQSAARPTDGEATLFKRLS